MIVSENSFDLVVSKISREDKISLDCESTGLYPYLGDRLFSVIIGTNEEEFYFNFNRYDSHNGEYFPDSQILGFDRVRELLGSFRGLIYLHNAKYDMALLRKEGLDISDREIWCTLAQGRIENNDKMNYQLATLAKEIGYKKDDRVKEYCDEHNLYTREKLPGKKMVKKNYHFDQVPPSVIVPYGFIDAQITYRLGEFQLRSMIEQKKSMKKGASLVEVSKNETKLTPILYKMEHKGLRLDMEYLERFIPHCEKQMEKSCEIFEEITGMEFKDSGKVFAEAFDKIGEAYPLTEKGNPSFKKTALDLMNSPAAQAIKDYRKSKSHFNYLQSFRYHADKNGIMHGNAKQGGTFSGRMSYEDPPLQCIEKGDDILDQEFTMRRCVIPFEDSVLAAIDYDQMEYRLMLDYAEEMDVIEQVQAGVDVHTATAEMMNVDRKKAKTLNFMLLYGGGISALCSALYKPKLPEFQLKEIQKRHFYDEIYYQNIARDLKLDPEIVYADIELLERAKADKDNYFKSLPNVEKLVEGIKGTAKRRGYIFNWFGRKLRFNNNTYYKAPNGLIQGGCADIVKVAMVDIDKIINLTSNDMLLNVHDEILFNVTRKETNIIPLLKRVMEDSYKPKHLKLTAGAEIGEKNWQDKIPYGEFK